MGFLKHFPDRAGVACLPTGCHAAGNLGFFNAEEVAPVGDYELMPEGMYTMIVDASEVKTPKSGNGEMLSLTLKIVDGKYDGRLVFENITLQNANEKAVQIGKGKLSALCRAVGVLQLTDSTQLHDKPFLAKLKIGKARDGYEPRNEVAKYEPKGGAVPVAASGLPADLDGDVFPF